MHEVNVMTEWQCCILGHVCKFGMCVCVCVWLTAGDSVSAVRGRASTDHVDDALHTHESTDVSAEQESRSVSKVSAVTGT